MLGGLAPIYLRFVCEYFYLGAASLVTLSNQVDPYDRTKPTWLCQ
jgi:hypothetical protein